MNDLPLIKAMNNAIDKMRHTEINNQYVMFLNKAVFFAAQEKLYFVIGTRIVINPGAVAHKRKYKRHLEEIFASFQRTNVYSYPAFKTLNAAKRAVSYNRKHSWLTENQEKETEINGIKAICIEPNEFETTIELEEKR